LVKFSTVFGAASGRNSQRMVPRLVSITATGRWEGGVRVGGM